LLPSQKLLAFDILLLKNGLYLIYLLASQKWLAFDILASQKWFVFNQLASKNIARIANAVQCHS